MRAPVQKKAAHGFDRSPIAGRLPILFDPALAGFLSKVNALGRAPTIRPLPDWPEGLTFRFRILLAPKGLLSPEWSVG